MTRVPALTLTVSHLWCQLRATPTQAPLWLELARAYAAADLPWQTGYTARQALRLDQGLLPSLQVLTTGPWQNAAVGDALLGRASFPEAATLAERFAVQVQACAGDWLSWLYLARLQDMSGEVKEQDALQQAQALEPIAGESLHWLGVWRLNAGDAVVAVTALSGLLDIRPVRFGSMMTLGEALLRTGQTAAAEKAFARASLSNNPDFLQTLAARVYAHNYWQEAIQVLQKASALQPTSVPVWLALAKIQSEVHSLADCRLSGEQADLGNDADCP